MKIRHPDQPPVHSIDVESVDECVLKIEKAGGKIVVPKTTFPTVGWLTCFTDIDGNIHGIYQNDPHVGV